MPASMLSYMGIIDSGNKDKDKAKEKDKDKDNGNLQQRVKTLLKETGNKQCAECRGNKPKWMALLQTPISHDQRQLGVFVCGNCYVFHKALGAKLCQVKSLKEPDTWTPQDIETLEKSGNAAVNAIYMSKMEGNHTDKHLGALASASFVESKYKNCAYFKEEAYHEQMELRAKLQAGEQDQDKEPEFSTEEDHNNHQSSNSGLNNGETMSLHDSMSASRSPLEMDESIQMDSSQMSTSTRRLSRRERIAMRRQSQSVERGSSIRRQGSYGGHASLRGSGHTSAANMTSLLGNTGMADDSEMDSSCISTASTRLRRSISTDGSMMGSMRRGRTNGSIRGRRTTLDPNTALSFQEKRERSRSKSHSRRATVREALKSSALDMPNNRRNSGSDVDMSSTETDEEATLSSDALLFKDEKSVAATVTTTASTIADSTKTTMGGPESNPSDIPNGEGEEATAGAASTATDAAASNISGVNSAHGASRGERSRRGMRKSLANESGAGDRLASRKPIRKSKSMDYADDKLLERPRKPGQRKTRKSISPMPPGRRALPPRTKSNDECAFAGAMKRAGRSTRRSLSVGRSGGPTTKGSEHGAAKNRRRSGLENPGQVPNSSSMSRRGNRSAPSEENQDPPILKECDAAEGEDTSPLPKERAKSVSRRQSRRTTGDVGHPQKRGTSASRRLKKRSSAPSLKDIDTADELRDKKSGHGDDYSSEMGVGTVAESAADLDKKSRRGGRRSMAADIPAITPDVAGATTSQDPDKKSRRVGREKSTGTAKAGDKKPGNGSRRSLLTQSDHGTVTKQVESNDTVNTGMPKRKSSSRTNLKHCMSGHGMDLNQAEKRNISTRPTRRKDMVRSKSLGNVLGKKSQAPKLPESDADTVERLEFGIKASKISRVPSDKELFSRVRGKPDMRSCILRALSSRDLAGAIKDMPRTSIQRNKSDNKLSVANTSTEKNHRRRLVGHLAATEGAIPKESLKSTSGKGKDEKKKRLDNLRDQYKESFSGLKTALSDPHLVAKHIASSSRLADSSAGIGGKGLLGGDDAESSSSDDHDDILGPPNPAGENDGERSEGSLTELQESEETPRNGFEASLDLEELQKPPRVPRDVAPKQQHRRNRSKSAIESRRSKSTNERKKANREEADEALRESEGPNGKEQSSKAPKKHSLGRGGAPVKRSAAAPITNISSDPFTDNKGSTPTSREEASGFLKKIEGVDITAANDIFCTPLPTKDSKPRGKQLIDWDQPIPVDKRFGAGKKKPPSLSPWENIGFDDDATDFPETPRDLEMGAARLVPVNAGFTPPLGTDNSPFSRPDQFSFGSDFSDAPSRTELGYGDLDESAPDSDLEESFHSQRSARTEQASARQLLCADNSDSDAVLEADEEGFQTPVRQDFRRRSKSSIDESEEDGIDPFAIANPVLA